MKHSKSSQLANPSMLEEDVSRIKEAKNLGVKSVPALVVDHQVYHINHGASMKEVKNG